MADANSTLGANIITRTQADTTIRLSHTQYQELATRCKEHAGQPLNLASVEDMEGDWAQFNYWAMPVIDDVTQPNSKGRERAYIYLVNCVDTGAVRAAGRHRPECDWSKLKNSEMFSFVVWHEIGHVRDNFHPMDVAFATDLTPEAKEAAKKARYINEVLADRFAWERVRPGQPIPLTNAGRLNADQIERDIEELSRYFIRAKYPLKPLEPDQYRHVPSYMLSSKRKAAYVGPDVNPNLLEREIRYYRAHFKKHGHHMRGVAL